MEGERRVHHKRQKAMMTTVMPGKLLKCARVDRERKESNLATAISNALRPLTAILVLNLIPSRRQRNRRDLVLRLRGKRMPRRLVARKKPQFPLSIREKMERRRRYRRLPENRPRIPGISGRLLR